MLVDRGDGRQERGRPPLHRVEDLVDVEAREEHEPGPDAHREGQAQREPVGVEERQDGVDGLPAVEQARHPRPSLQGVGPQVAVGQDGALGSTGGATGVLQQRHITARGPGMGRIQRPGLLDKPLPAQCARGRTAHRGTRGAGLGNRKPQQEALDQGKGRHEVHTDNRLHRGLAGDLLHDGHGLVPHDRDAGSVVGQLVLQLTRGVERVVLHDDRAEPQDGIEGHHVLRAVGQRERHPVPSLDTQPPKRLRRALHLLAQLGVGGRAAVEVQRHQRSESLHRVLEHVEQGLVRHIHGRRNPRSIAAQPRSIGRHSHRLPDRGGSPARPSPGQRQPWGPACLFDSNLRVRRL